MSDLFKFDEINASYSLSEAIDEAQRCLECKNALCMKGCPIDNEIPLWIHELKKGNFGNAISIIRQKSNLPAICGRVCAHERQCEGNCVLLKQGKPAINIGKLERFVADFDAEAKLVHDNVPEHTRGNVAVFGSGPSGLTVAGDLCRMGFNVDMYEVEPHCGGMLRYGIPQYRLPKEVVTREVSHLAAIGVNIHRNYHVGINETIDDFFDKGYDAIYIGTGLTKANTLGIPGENCKDMIDAMYFLTHYQLYREGLSGQEEINVEKGQKVFVIGGGNTAMDAARTAVRLGADVEILYRKTQAQMPALESEYRDSLAEGIKYRWLTNVKEVHMDGDGKMTHITIEYSNSETNEITSTIIPADKVIVAIGSAPSKRIIRASNGIESDSKGYVITREEPYGMTSRRGVFAGGDVANRQATVVHAMCDAKKVAQGIAKYVDAVKLMETI